MAPAAEFVWLDGNYVRWEDAQVHLMTHTLHYGLGVFEGIRAYESSGGVTIFRLRDHLERLHDSAKVCGMELPCSLEDLEDVCLEVIRRNRLGACYLRPLAFHGDGDVGLGAINPVRLAVAAFPWGAYLGKEGLQSGIRCTVSSYVRQHVGSAMLRAKICGQYTTSILAKRLALKNGYQEAIFLDAQGYVCEGSGENLFLVKNGVLKTPPESQAILPGITRESVITLAQHHADSLGLEVREERFARDELLLADEVFLTGTAAEVTPVREIDGTVIGGGSRGPITEKLQSMFFQTVRGDLPSFRHWLTGVGQLSASGEC